MLNSLLVLQGPVVLGLGQAAVAACLALLVVLLARRESIHLERETLVALIRGLVQVVAVGSVLVAILKRPLWLGILILAVMIVVAAATAARRAKDVPGAFRVSLYGIGLSSGVVIALMTWAGAIGLALSSLIPVSSMLIAGAMNSGAQALDRFRADVRAHVGQIEAGLALGADPRTVVTPYAQAAIHASLIPRIDSLRSLGIVWIPGLMAGMILSGSDPIYAATYQFAVIAMIYAASGLTSVITTLLIRTRAFSPAEQLVLRPGGPART